MLEITNENLIINDNEKEISEDKNKEINNDEEEVKFISENEKETKENLVNILKRLETDLNLKKNESKTINEIYHALLNNDDITKKAIKENANSCLLIFMFYFIAPLVGIIFLIGIFQLISLKKALSGIIKDSVKHYYKCTFKDDCNITLYNNQTNETYINVYDFYNYFYNSSMNEDIDFNLMMITGFIGDSLLLSRGFRKSSIILSLFNFGCLFWLFCFNFSFEKDGVFDYSIIKILCIIICYIFLLIGIGGSALLPLKILSDRHLNYKDYIFQKQQEKLDDEIKEKEINHNKELTLLKANENEKNIDGNINEERQNKEDEEIQNKKRRIFKKKKNRFYFFFMICFIITIAYYGKYAIDLLLNFILKKIYGEGYNKEQYFILIIILYFSSLLLPIILYSFFLFIFRKNKKEKEEEISNMPNLWIYYLF